MTDNKAAKIIRRFELLKTQRANWETHWDEVSQYFIPKKDEIFGQRTRGEKKYNLLYDSTSVHSVELLASALQGMLTSPTSIWFGLSTGKGELDKDDDVRKWLQETTVTIINALNNSNFQQAIHEVYIDIVSFGTSILRIEEDDKEIFRFDARPVYETYLSEDERGMVDTVYYKLEMTLKQIANRFGEDVLTEDMKRELVAEPDKREIVIHAVEPRKDLEKYDIKVPTKMPYASIYILERTQTILKESGFKSNPHAVARWSKTSNEVYGRSPAMKSLSDAKMINKMKKATIEAAQLAVAPPMQVPDDGVLLPVRLTPNSINYYRAGTKDRIEPLTTANNVPLSEQMMETVKQQIRQAFFIDQLQLVQNDRMTTVEVVTRRDESLRLLAPILGRFNNEILKPLIERIFDMMLKRKMFTAPPAALSEMDLDIRYTSMIAKAQLAAEGENFGRFMGMVAPMIQLQPQSADKLNGDEVIDYGAQLFGLPTGLIRTDSEVAEVRQARQELQEQQEQMEQEQHQADIASKTAQ